MNRRAFSGLVLGAVLAAGSALAAKDFSADVSLKNMQMGQPTKAKIQASGEKLRIETKDDQQHSVMLFDQKKNQGWLMMPEHKMVMPLPDDVVGEDMSGLRRENPCDGQDEYTCKKAGSEQIAGRKTNKWVATNGEGKQVATFWVDPKLAYPLKVEREEFTMELTNVKEGPQPANLFVIPKDYQQMEMGVGGAGE